MGSPGRREPVAHSLPVLLLEVALRVPLLAETDADPARSQAAERIAGILERFAGVVGASGGRLLGVADLTLLACWPSSRAGVSATATEALCALDRLAGWLRDAGTDHQLRAAVVAGTSVLGSFGGLGGRWLNIASGSAAEQLGAALELCEAGEAVLSAGILLPGQRAESTRALRDGWQAVTLEPGFPWTDQGAERPLVEGRTAPLTPCSVVAVRICGADRQRSDYPARLHGAVRSLQRSARVHGGVLAELRHDHRGLFGFVLFDADRGRARRAALGALRFGHELGGIMADQGLDAPAAVTTAAAWTWPVEAAWATVGSAVDSAVSLVRCTASELVCDASTAALARDRVRLEPLPRQDGEHGYIVEHVDPSRARRWTVASGVVGRREELARLDQLVGEFLSGSTGVLLVEGELGLGKSRLVDELVARLRSERCRVLVGYGVPGATAAPLAPWRGILLQLIGLDASVEPAECDRVLRERLAEVGADLDLEALAGLLPLGDELASPPSGAGRLLDSVAPLVELFRGQDPLLVVIEDGQWLDSASWSLARELATTLDDLLLVVALRTDNPEQTVEAQRLAALPETSVVVLRGLGASELAELVQRELGLQDLPEDLLEWLRASTSGNPLLCLEWVRQLLDEGQLVSDEGKVIQAPAAESLTSQLPADLPSLLERRIRMLPPQLGRTLAVCTRAGGVFETDLVVEVHPDGVGRLRVNADLEQLANAGLVQPAAGRSERAYCVIHPAVVDAARDRLDAKEHAALHAAIASWFEQRHDDLSPYYPLLAQHWLEAGRNAAALRYLELAGAQALRSGAMPEAARHFQQALRLSASEPVDGVPPEPLRRAHWERNLGDARYACGELDRCSVHYDRALRLVGYGVPRGRVHLALYAAWQLARQLLHRLLPDHRVEAPPTDHPRLLEASHAAERLAERYYYSADALSLCSSSVLSANLADRTGLHGRNARPYASMSYLIGLLGLGELSERVYQRALRIGEQAPDPAGLAVALYTRSTFHAGRAEWEPALELAERAIGTAASASAWQEQGVAYTMHALCQFLTGAFGPAESAYGELLGIARDRYNAQHEAWALYGIGQCQHRVGRLHEASRSVRQGLAVLRNLDDYPSRLICHGVLASIHTRLGQHEQARVSADRAWAQVKRVRVPFVLPTLEGISGMTEAYLELWALELASGATHSGLEAQVRAALRTLALFARIFPVGRPRHLLAAGRLAEIRGRRGRAWSAWSHALAESQRLGLPLEQAEAQVALAAHPDCGAERAAELAGQARNTLMSMGCAWHLERLEDQQGQSQ